MLLQAVLVTLISSVGAISQVQYDTLVQAANYAEIAYCMSESNFSTGSLATECVQDPFCPLHPEVNIVKLIEPDFSQLELSGDAYVAVDNTTQTVIVAFRGTETVEDWITDLTFGFCDYAPYLTSNFTSDELAAVDTSDAFDYLIAALGDTDACPGSCKVHCGLFIAYTQFMDEILEVVAPYMDDGAYELVVTGHSLGGGFAGLAGADFMIKGWDPLLITFASLKQGNKQYNEFVDDLFGTAEKNASVSAGDAFVPGTYVRVYEVDDLVPRLPPGLYTNGGLEFQLNTTVVPQTADEVLYYGPSDNEDDDSEALSLANLEIEAILEHHAGYFVSMGEPCSEAWPWVL